MLLRQNDKHFSANINHLQYSMAKFEDVIELNGLAADFNHTSNYCKNLT